MAETLHDTRDQVTGVAHAVATRVREEPYPVLALAAMVGYVMGGGLFSRVTRPLSRAALGALLVPAVRERLRSLSDEFRSTQPTGAG